MKGSHEATHVFHRPRRNASSIPVRLMSLLAFAALVGGSAYSRADDDALNFGGTDNQNELRGPTRHLAVEMHEGTNMAAVPSPDGTRQQVTTGTGAESNPVVPPDGTKIAFVNTGNTIYTMPANLSAAPTQFGSGSYPQWTPDSQNLVYQNTGNLVVNGNAVTSGEDMFPFPVHYMGANQFVYTASGKIRTRDANGGNLQDIAFSATQVLRRPVITPLATRPSLAATTPQPVQGINGPVLSPDGQSIAFIALNDLWMMKIGQAPVRLTNDTNRDVDPRWTADGRFIYWSTDKNNAGNLPVDKIDVVTRQRTRFAAIH